MPALQVKDFPSDLYDQLRECAAAQDRSISQQTVHVLREYLRAYRQLGGRTGWEVLPVGQAGCEGRGARRRAEEEERERRIERRKRIFAEIDALPKIEIPDDFPEPAEIARQMREEHDDRIVPELRHIR